MNAATTKTLCGPFANQDPSGAMCSIRHKSFDCLSVHARCCGIAVEMGLGIRSTVCPDA